MRPISYNMISPISSSHTVAPNQIAPPAARQPQPQPAATAQDTVTLKSASGDKAAGDPDHDGK
jgi:hypothetical protein